MAKIVGNSTLNSDTPLLVPPHTHTHAHTPLRTPRHTWAAGVRARENEPTAKVAELLQFEANMLTISVLLRPRRRRRHCLHSGANYVRT